ncbi:MAG: Type 3 secretion system secretin [Holosporales bacterium]
MKSLFLILCALLGGCSGYMLEKNAVHPAKTKSEMQEILKPQTPLPSFKKKKKTIAKKTYPKALLKPISLRVGEKTPLKQVLITLAEQAEIDIQLDPDIDARIVYTATHQPFIHILENICQMTQLRLIIKGESVRIEKDLPYSKNYNLQFLNIERQSNNHISTATDIFSNMNGNSKVNEGNASSSQVNVKGENSFWKEVENNIKIILNDQEGGNFSIHKQGGIISIRTTQRQHDLIEEYLEQLKRVSGRQVLIEAKIIEVVLNDDYKSGINWQSLTEQGFQFQANFANMGKEATMIDKSFANRNSFNIGGRGRQFSGILSALEDFGTSRTLSSPRLTVMNNQIAVLKVAQNKVYFKLNYDRQFSMKNDFENFNLSSDIHTIPIGLIMSVQPSIDEEADDIILCLRPTISKLSGTENDPAVDITLANAKNPLMNEKKSGVPVVDVKEIDSVLRVKSGEVAILGGLMEVQSIQDQTGVPGSSELPIIRDIFGATSSSDRVVELVILLKATIVDQPNIHDADANLSKNYISDSRPF